jgi:hypothetical protein
VVRVGRTSAVDVRETLSRNANGDKAIHAFLTVTAERALARAFASRPASDTTGPLQ